MKALLVLLCCFSALAYAKPPSDASLRQLIDVSGGKQMLDASMDQVQDMIRGVTAEVVARHEDTPAVRAAAARAEARMLDVLRKFLGWEKNEAMMLTLYRDGFSQADVDAMIAFYSSPAGRAMIEKMPAIMQKLMVHIQADMQTMMPEIQRIAADLQADLNAAKP